MACPWRYKKTPVVCSRLPFPWDARVVSLNRPPVSYPRPIRGLFADLSWSVCGMYVAVGEQSIVLSVAVRGLSWGCRRAVRGPPVGCSRAARGLPVRGPWDAPCISRELSMGYPWPVHGLPEGGPWTAHELPAGYRRPASGMLMGCP